MPDTATPASEVTFPGRRWHVAIAGPEPLSEQLPEQLDLLAALLQAEARELHQAGALAEAFGVAWCEHERGGSVTLRGAVESHPWWPALRTWLPPEAPLRVLADGDFLKDRLGDRLGEPLPQAPWPPVALTSLPRNGVPPFPLTDVSAAFDWLAEHEPHTLLIEASAEESHPALVIAHAAIAGQGVRVCWRINGRPDWLALTPALMHIGGRQLPLQLLVDEPPPTPIPGWWIATPIDASATAAALTYHLLHEWPAIIVVNATPAAPDTPAAAWEPAILCVVRAGDTPTVCLPEDVLHVEGPVVCPTTLQPAPRTRGARFVGPQTWGEALGYLS